MSTSGTVAREGAGSNSAALRVVVATLAGALLLLGLAAVLGHYQQRAEHAGDPALVAGQEAPRERPEDRLARHLAEYRANPVPETLHLLPAFVFFALAPLQFVSAIRRRTPWLHRWVGRTCVLVGLVTGAFSLVLAVLIPFGGWIETVLTVPLGGYFLWALVLGWRHARTRRFTQHRVWMIRALAAALAVSAQRVWLGVLLATIPGMTLELAFNVSILLGVATTIGTAELYLRWVPTLRAQPVSL